MSVATEQAVAQALLVHDEVFAEVDDKTLEIVERRRRTAIVRRRGWLIRRLLVAADVVGLIGAFAVSDVLAPASAARVDHIGFLGETLFFVTTLPLWVVVAKLHGLYDHDEERTDHATPDDLLGVMSLVTIGTWMVFVVSWLTGRLAPSPLRLICFWGLAILFVSTGRLVARYLARRQLAYVQNTLVVGAGAVGQLVARKFLQHPEYGINLVGFVDADPKPLDDELSHLRVLGSLERVPAILRLLDVERVVVAFSGESHEEELSLIRAVRDFDVQVDIVPRLFEAVGKNVGIHMVEGVPLVGLPPPRLSHSSHLLKRTFDLATASIALLILAPVFAVIAWRIKADSPGPVFFRQVRMGRGDKTFRIFKFRTMVSDADERKDEVAHLNMHATSNGDPRMFKVPEDPRVTRFGAFLRRYSLDELPQLLNVFLGDMSLVGPRPLILDEDRFVAQWARGRLDLKPGITGLWQVLGASEIPFKEMTRLDYIYVTNWSLWGDFCLLFKTVPAVMRERKAY